MTLLLWGLALLQMNPPQDVSFFIEAIELAEASHISRDIALAQMRLRPGGVISEPELRQAMRRLEQLPFVLEAEFQLVKGSERGKYKLKVTLVETAPFFANLTLRRDFRHEGRRQSLSRVNLGYRHFIGASSLLYASWSPEHVFDGVASPDQFDVGFSHFNLFNRDVFFNLELSYRGSLATSQSLSDRSVETEIEDGFDWSVNASLPISDHQWLRLDVRRGIEEQRDRSIFPSNKSVDFVEIRQQVRADLARLIWEHNTTDDAFLPNSGDLAQLGVHWERTRLSSTTQGFPDPVRVTESKGLSLDLYRFKRLAGKQTLPMRLSARWDRATETLAGNDLLDRDLRYAEAAIGFQWRTSTWWRGRALGEIYLGSETGFSVERDRFQFLFSGGSQFRNQEETGFIETFAAFRSHLGFIRFSLRYERADLTASRPR